MSSISTGVPFDHTDHGFMVTVKFILSFVCMSQSVDPYAGQNSSIRTSLQLSNSSH